MQSNFYDITSEIDKLIQQGFSASFEKIEDLFVHAGIRDYFFRRMGDIDNPKIWLEPLKEKGYLDPSNNPKIVEISGTSGYRVPFWSVLRYLDNLSIKNSENPSDKVSDELCTFVESVITYKDNEDKRTENPSTDWFVIKILSNLPIGKIKPEYIAFVRTTLLSSRPSTLIPSEIGGSLLRNLISKRAKHHLISLLDIMLQYRVDGQNIRPLMEGYQLSNALKQNTQEIADICGTEAAELAILEIKSILAQDESRFTIGEISTIEAPSEHRSAYTYGFILVSFIRDMLEMADSSKVEVEVSQLIKEKHQIFRRIAVHTINRRYEELSKLFWDWPGNPLEDIGLKHEIYELLKANCKSFSEDLIDKVIYWIESKEYTTEDNTEDAGERDKKIAYRKREWLSALLESQNAKVIARYREYEKINPAKIEHPGYLYWTEFSWGTSSPKQSSEILDMPNDKIADYLNNFAEEPLGIRGPTKEGLIDEIRGCATSNPQKFAEDLQSFKNIDLVYQSVILSGICEAWRKNRTFDWSMVLNFAFDIIQQESFWQWKRADDIRDYKGWVVSAIADLIEAGTEKDEHAFVPELLPKAEQILLILAEKAESELHEGSDIITSVLNAPKGKVFSAMMNYSLRVARFEKKPQGGRWAVAIREDFSRRLDRNVEPSLDFSVILGQYLHGLFYLDQDWVKGNIDRIFPMENNKHWRASITGYLFYSRTIYKEVYFLLREMGHYSKAIKTHFIDRDIDEHVVQHIVIGYIENWESLDNDKSLIYLLLHNKNTQQLSEIINFLWRIRDNLKPEHKDKVRPLWKALTDLLSLEKDDPEYKKVIAQLPMFLDLLDKIDDEMLKWLKLSAQCVPEGYGYHTDHFIELLAKHVSNTPAYVAEIFIEVLNSGVFPDYPEDKIIALVEKLYTTGEKDSASRICNMYGEKGSYLLRDLYLKHKENGDG